MRVRRPVGVTVGFVLIGALLVGCGDDDDSAAGSGGDEPIIGVDYPRADSDFWNSYITYTPQMADELGAKIETTSSDNDITNLVANVQTLTNRDAKAIVMAPQDTAAIAPTLEQLESDDIPVVTIDTRPDTGNVFMVVRADNRAYGEKACMFLGEQLGGTGKVVEFQGALSSVNGRDRSEAFIECMDESFPDIEVFELATDWEGDVAASKLQTVLTTDPDINGIYMQAGGVFLAPTLQLLRQEGKLVPPDDPNHVFIVSNDGIPEELEAIRSGDIDATVSQPADLYARYGLFYAQAALEGETFEPRPTDHDSTIRQVRSGVLEDQLPAPLVTSENVDDDALWGNQID
jgi:ribose transport system substrate-binding protein